MMMMMLLLLLMMMTMAIVIMMMMVLRAPHVNMQQHSPTIQSQPRSCSCWEFEGSSAPASSKGGGACIQHFVRDSPTSRPPSRARLSFPASSGGSSDVDSVFGGSAAKAPEFATVNLWTVR